VTRPSTLPVWLIVAMFALIGLNLRANLGSIPPLLDNITEDLGLNGTQQGLLTSMAVVSMGMCAPLGQRLAARIGTELATTLCLGLVSFGCLIRLTPGNTALLLVSVVIAGAGMGGGSALMPALIGHHVPRIAGITMGIYSAGLTLGIGIAAGIAVPSAAWLGGWRPALALWGVVAAATAIVWRSLARALRGAPLPEHAQPVSVDQRLPWGSATARWVTLFSTSQILLGFSGIAWITPLYVHLGAAPQGAANHLVLFQTVQLLTMLTLPAITDFTRDRRPLLALTLLFTILGIAGLLIAPFALAIPALTLFGLGVGGGATLGLVLIIDTTRTRGDAARLAALVLLVAYLVGAVGPVLLGLLRDLTGDFVAGYGVMLGVAILMLAVVPAYRPGRTIVDAGHGAEGIGHQ